MIAIAKKPARAPLDDAARALCDRDALAIARRVAARFARSYPVLADEFHSAAPLAVAEAARAYRPDTGTAWPKYLAHRAAGAMKDVLRAWRPQGYRRGPLPPFRVGRLEEPRVEGPRGPLSRADVTPSGELPVGWAEEAADAVAGLCRGLPAAHREVVLRLYTRSDTTTMARVGRAMGLSEPRVSQIHRQALAWIRARLAPPEERSL